MSDEVVQATQVEDVQATKAEDEAISKEDLAHVADKRAKSQMALLIAQKALAESQAAELEYRNSVLHLFVKYRMMPTDHFDDNSGAITRAVQENKSE